MNKLFLIASILLISSILSGQEQKKDSILRIIKTTKSNTVKSKEYLALANISQQKDSIKTLVEQSIYYARLAKDYKLLYDSRTKKAFWIDVNISKDAAIYEFNNMLTEFKNSKLYLASIYYNIGSEYNQQSVYDSSDFYVKKGIKIGHEIKNDNIITRGYMILGNFYLNKNDFTNAFKMYSKADSICDNNDSLKISAFHAKLYNYLGYAVRVTDGYKKTLGYYLKSKSIYEKLNDNKGIQELNTGLAQLYANEDKFNDALPLINEAIKYYKYDISGPNYTYAIIVRGYLFIKMKRFVDAEKDYLEYYDIIFKSHDKALQSRAVGYLAYMYKMKKDYGKSIALYNRAISMHQQYDSKKTDLYEELIGIYTETKNYKMLSKTYEEYINVRDEIDKNGTDKKIFELETKYETAKKEKEIAVLTTKNSLAEAKKARQRNLFIGIFLIIISGFASLFYMYKNKIKTAQKLTELNELKSKFFANISHEFRTPLTLIKSPLQNLQTEITNDSQLKQLKMIDKNSGRLLELVDQLLELSKIDSGKLKLILKEGNVSLFLASIVEPYEFQAKENQFLYSGSIEKNTENHYFDKDVIQKIVTNLLSNALKYTTENGSIHFESKIHSNHLEMVFNNSNSEIRKEDLAGLFERFYQKSESHQGFGIGLALVNELVELYDGKIETSLENSVLSFKISLPLEKNRTNAIVISPQTKIGLPQNIEDSNELPILLIIDDNSDLRALLKDLFQDEYAVLEAKNGLDGLKIAQKEVPDCIISDVMMPGMDGLEFARKIKTNELTSFIPVLLLTANTSEETRLAGLQNEADAFLTKPFNNEIVKAQVVQLINERKKLQNRYSQELILKPTDIIINSYDEKFIEKLQQLLEKNIPNPEFTANEFAGNVNMSRMQLHRKLKALFGISATEFIRIERLKVAAELLKKENLTISEIAYAVGFNDVSYFNKSFKKMYNSTPGDYSKLIK